MSISSHNNLSASPEVYIRSTTNRNERRELDESKKFNEKIDASKVSSIKQKEGELKGILISDFQQIQREEKEEGKEQKKGRGFLSFSFLF